MKRARSPDPLPDAKAPRVDREEDQESVGAHVLGIQEMRAAILVEHSGDLMQDVATLVRWRLVSKAFARTLDAAYPIQLAAIPCGAGDILPWTWLATHVSQVARRHVVDPRFVDMEWLDRDTMAVGRHDESPTSRSRLVLAGWARGYPDTRPVRLRFLAIVHACLGARDDEFKVTASDLIHVGNPVLLRAYLHGVRHIRTTRIRLDELEYVFSKALWHEKTAFIRNLVKYYPDHLHIMLTNYARNTSGSDHDRINKWLLGHCRAIRARVDPRGAPVPMPSILGAWLEENDAN